MGMYSVFSLGFVTHDSVLLYMRDSLYPYVGIRKSLIVYLLFSSHAIAPCTILTGYQAKNGENYMVMQSQKTTAGKAVDPATSGVGYAQPSLEILSCRSCGVRGGCLLEQMTISHGHSYQVVKNRKVYLRGEHIFRAGDDSEAIYVISSGSVKSYMIMEDGEEQVLNFYQAGDVLGLDGMGADRCISSTAALESTTICRLPLSELPHRELGQGFLNMISDYLICDHNLLLMLARKDADGRMASFIVNMSKQSKRLGRSADVLHLTMTRQDIANYLGLAIETVSRTLRRFQDSGMLEVTRRRIEIYDFECLLLIAGTQITR
ncbi:MAG: helix-turn-helix domain-containing protein [Gammaproteobacteria bacterium]|nr:helix-turn-helix domain-containing protein [Gammaproteobacteria bacterium]